VHYHSVAWFRTDPWSWLSLSVACMSFVEVAILAPLKATGIRMISLVRIINLMRLKKVIEHDKRFKELKLVLRGMVGSWVSLFWAVCCLMLVMFVYSIWTTTWIGYHEGFDEINKLSNGWDAQELFGSIMLSMFTLTQVMTLDAWASLIARQSCEMKPYFVVVFGSFILVSTYGIMNLIVSIIVEQTLEASSQNEGRTRAREEKQRNVESESFREIFMLADADGNGDLTIEEFTEAVETDSEVQWRLKQLELDLDAANSLFQVMDGDGSRTLKMKEFVHGLGKLKGNAQAKDLLALQHQADSMSGQMDALAAELKDSERMLSRLDSATARMNVRFAHTLVSSRKAIAERVRGSAPSVPPPHIKAGVMAPGHLATGNRPQVPLMPNLSDY